MQNSNKIKEVGQNLLKIFNIFNLILYRIYFIFLFLPELDK